MSVQVVELTVVRKTCPVCPGPLPSNPPSTAYINEASFGSKTACMTFRGGRFRVMLMKVTPGGGPGPTVAASAFVDKNTR
jgi:hypothetical protein